MSFQAILGKKKKEKKKPIVASLMPLYEYLKNQNQSQQKVLEMMIC
jgi:hypothetical protein